MVAVIRSAPTVVCHVLIILYVHTIAFTQLAVDATLVSAVRRDGSARLGAASFVGFIALLLREDGTERRLNNWKLCGSMNYRRLGGGVGVVKMPHADSHFW